MFDTDTTDAPIVALPVSDDERLAFLPTAFPGCYLRLEMAIYDWMGRLSPDYSGGFWNFVRLSNGGAFIWPQRDGPLSIVVEEGNGYAGAMSAEAAGIVACLFAINALSFQPLPDDMADMLAMRYDQLRLFAAGHPEHSAIFRAID